MRVRATALLIKDDEFLVMHRNRNGKEYYVLPGGGIEEGESAEQATIRELQEETSIHGKIIKKLWEFYQPDFDTEHQVFLVEHHNEEPKMDLESFEAQKNNRDNAYKPMWMKKSAFKNVTFYPPEQVKFLEELFK